MCYYGHVQNTSNLGEGNVYKSYFLGALVELPCWSVPIIISKLGRRWNGIFTSTLKKFFLKEHFRRLKILRARNLISWVEDWCPNYLHFTRWPLLVFFATSGVVGVVYGFISPEWPLTLLSVGLTGEQIYEILNITGIEERLRNSAQKSGRS